ncbi:MAG TPA: discoidin domain-containing protein [Sedimentisphaerales bacterium]|jgi:regulation of enolase protein 1 (concanavalin A-like superfamily)|nr:discoidin domain-containing protein [Sedimentisphaerales bacterium]
MYRKSVLWLAVIGAFLTAGVAGADQFIVKINFQLETAAVPDGYLMDCGEMYGDRGNGYSYGWSALATSDDRERNANNDQRYDTLVHFSKGSDKTWEIAVPEGDYDLFFVCGDASNTDQTNTLDVEGVIFTDPDGQDNFDEYSGRVTVTDGRLTIKPATGASNAKICFIDIIQYLPPNQAQKPVPENGAADVARDVVLAWTAGAGAGKHNVYLGTDLDDVNDATVANDLGTLVSTGQADAAYESPSVLAWGQTYYWRIDEVNATDSTVSKGELWTFTVETYGYPITGITATASGSRLGMGPEKTIDRSGLANDQHSMAPEGMWVSAGTLPNWIQYEFDQVYKLQELWVWNSNMLLETIAGYGAKDVTIEYSLDGAAWETLADAPEFAQAPSTDTYVHNTTVDLGGVWAKYVKLNINATWGGGPNASLSEVRFYYIPVAAFYPDPTDGATDVDLEASLNWRPGREAGSHKVYFDSDAGAVAAGTVAAKTVADHRFSPTGMLFGTTYYWRVDEVNEAMDPSPHEGSVWSFTTREYESIDDFEAYNDTDNCLYDSWIDGYTDHQSNSFVGYMDSFRGTFGETTIVYDGGQSMPFEYNNGDTPYFSEAYREFSPTRDWSIAGADTLLVNVRGDAPGFAEMGDGSIVMGGIGSDIWNASDQFHFAFKQLSGNGTIIAKVESLTRANEWTKVGLMVRESVDPAARYAAVYITPDYGVRYQARLTNAGTAVSDSAVATPEQIAMKAPVWLKLERSGNNFNAYYSADGATWTAMVWNPQSITLSGTICIGLAVTSHNTADATAARFSSVTVTGATGAWQTAQIGVAQPTSTPDTLYVVVQDNSGKSKVVAHPDPMVTVTPSWQQWKIPLSEFTAAGVKLTKVQKLYIGTGNRANPTKGGAGHLYIDGIGFGHPVADE